MAAFDLTQENVLTADPVNQGFSIQIGEVQVRGIELEGKFSVNDNLYVTGAYTYLDHEVTKSNGGDKGKRRPQIPRHNASLWANYSLNRGTLAGMGLGVGVRYFGKTEGDRLNTFSVPGYTLVDLAAHYDLGQSPFRLEGWRASLNVKNLFDKYYIASCASRNILLPWAGAVCSILDWLRMGLVNKRQTVLPAAGRQAKAATQEGRAGMLDEFRCLLL